MSSAADIAIIPVEVFTKFQTRFYADPVDGIIAVFEFDRRIDANARQPVQGNG